MCSTVGDIMSTVGDILSTVGVFSTVGDILSIVGCSVPYEDIMMHVGDITDNPTVSPTVLMISPHDTEHPHCTACTHIIQGNFLRLMKLYKQVWTCSISGLSTLNRVHLMIKAYFDLTHLTPSHSTSDAFPSMDSV